MIQTNDGFQASILNRLVDHDPDVSHEPVHYQMYSIEQIKTFVVSDLENLLNSRRSIVIVPAAYKEVNKSVFVYGLKDFTAENPKNPTFRQILRQDVEKTIMRFEPRLRNVAVHLETIAANDKNLRFRISGFLEVGSESEPVSFDTLFDTNRGQYVINK